MIDYVRPLVSSDVCLSCDGCCRFKEEQSSWRPKLAKEEAAHGAKMGLPIEIFSKNTSWPDGSVHTMICNGQHVCRFFSPELNSCSIYRARPFECQLYPFVLSKQDHQIQLCVHLACPFVQEKRNDPSFDVYVDYLKVFFRKPKMIDFIRRNPFLAGDYKEYQEELEYLFTVDLDLTFENEDNLINKINLFEKYRDQRPCQLSSKSMVSLFAWKEFFDIQFKVIHDHLCIFAESSVGVFMYLPPLGRGISSDLIEECFKIMKHINKGSGVSRIENVEESELEFFPKEQFTHYQKYDEYVYHRGDIAELKGNLYKSKRSSYNQFLKNKSFRFQPFQHHWQKACEELYRRWAEDRAQHTKDELYHSMLHENDIAHALMIKQYDDFGLIGRVVLIDGEVKAYSFGFPLKDDTFCVLFEITDPLIKGLPTYIFREFCSDPQVQPFKFINCMDDYGLDNIRKTKLSFRPSKILKSYVITQLRPKHEKF